MIEAYPLYWPDHKKRTKSWSREQSRFKSTFAVARDELLAEIERLRGKWHREGDAILSTNISLRQDGLPYANQKNPDDPGVAVYFNYKKQPRCFALDKYRTVWENMVGIRKTIQALRGIERWGSAEMMEQSFDGFIKLPDNSGEHWSDVLGVSAMSQHSEIVAAYKVLRSQHHPDKGGNAAMFDKVLKAFNEYKSSL